MSARSKLRTMASSSPSGRSPSSTGVPAAGGGGGLSCARTTADVESVSASRTFSIHRPFTASSSFSGGRPLRRADPGRSVLTAGSLLVLPQLIELLPHLCRKLLRSEEHTSELQSHSDLVCRLLLEKK